MSENWVTLICEDPGYVPDAARRERVRDRFAEIVRDADEIEIIVTSVVEFFDCGENFERILCPSCRAEIAIEWWNKRLDDDFENGGFKLAKYATPCCGSMQTLHDLIYEWPQGFGRFAISAMNPNIGLLDDADKKAFEEILGAKLRVIYQHI